MDVIVDGERNYAITGEPADVLAVVGEVTDFLQERGRAVLSVSIDGNPVAPEDIVEKLQGKGVTEIGQLEVQSAEISIMVENCLRELSEALPELPVACRNLAAVFQGETPEDGYDPFVELAGIWAHIKTRETLIADAIHLKLEELEIDGVTVSAIHEELNGYLEEAAQALQDGDCILLGDLLEYELAPRAEKETQIVELLRERAPANSG